MSSVLGLVSLLFAKELMLLGRAGYTLGLGKAWFILVPIAAYSFQILVVYCATVTIQQRVQWVHSFTAFELGKVRFSNLIRFAHSSWRFTTL